MEAPIPRRVDAFNASTLKRKGSTLQTSVEVFRCRFGKPTSVPDGDSSYSPSKEWTPIYYAVYHQREAALSHFLRTGGSPDDVNGTGQPPLCIAVGNGNTNIVGILLQASADVDATMRSSGETALHMAVKQGRSDLVDILLPYGPDLQAQTDETRDTPLHYAASKSGSLATIVAMLKAGAKYDTQNAKGQTPAEVALQSSNIHGAVAIINAAHGKRNKLLKEKEMLLKHVQKTQGRFSLGNDLIADIFTAACPPDSTVLVEAIKRDDASLVEMFLENGSDPDRLTAKGDRPIFMALECAGAPVIQALVKHNADVSVRNAQGLSVLQAAFEGSSAQDKEAMSAIFHALLKKGVNASITYPDGKTMLHRAVAPEFGHTRVAYLLISAGVGVNAQDLDGNTALHLAAHSRSCVDILLKNGADPRQINLNQLTPLLRTIAHSHKDNEPDLDSLIKVSDLRKTTADAQTALHLAASNGLGKTTRSLLRARAETTTVDSNNNTPLLLAVKKQQWSIVPLLTIPPSINSWDEDGMSALHHIAISVPREASTWQDIATAAAPFCERGVSRSMRDRSGATPLICAIKTLPEAGLPVIGALLVQTAERGASWNCVSHEDHKKRDALHYAIAMGKLSFVEALLKHGALFTFKDYASGKSTLDLSVGTNKQIMKLLVQCEWSRRAVSLRKQPGGPEVEVPAFSTTFPILDIKQMISLGLDVNALPRSPLGNSMLWAVLRHIPLETSMPPKYLLDVIKLILDAGADVNIGTARGSRRSPSPQSPQASKDSLPLTLHPLTFLLEECPTVDIDIVTLLLTKGTRLSTPSPFYGGRFPLHSATQANRMDVIDDFLLQRADVNSEDQNRRTPLFIAVEKGFWEIVDALLRRGAKLDVQDIGKNTPLHAAATGGSRKVIATLLRAGAKANVQNREDLTPLSCLPHDMEAKERDTIVWMLKDSEEKEKRHLEIRKQQAEQTAAHEAKIKHRLDVASKAQLRKEQDEEEKRQREQRLVSQSQKEPDFTQKAAPLVQPSPLLKAPQPTSLFKRSSVLFSRSKSTSPGSAALPKQTVVSMRITTPPHSTPSMLDDAVRLTSSPMLTSTLNPTITSSSATNDFYTVPTSKPIAPTPVSTPSKPLSTPRVDSGVGQKRPSDTEKPLPVLDRNQSVLDGIATDAKQRESGHELKDWLALSKMMENL